MALRANWSSQREFLLAEIADGRLRPQDLVTRTIGLAEAPAALAAVGNGSGSVAGITVVVP